MKTALMLLLFALAPSAIRVTYVEWSDGSGAYLLTRKPDADGLCRQAFSTREQAEAAYHVAKKLDADIAKTKEIDVTPEAIE